MLSGWEKEELVGRRKYIYEVRPHPHVHGIVETPSFRVPPCSENNEISVIDGISLVVREPVCRGVLGELRQPRI